MTGTCPVPQDCGWPLTSGWPANARSLATFGGGIEGGVGGAGGNDVGMATPAATQALTERCAAKSMQSICCPCAVTNDDTMSLAG